MTEETDFFRMARGIYEASERSRDEARDLMATLTLDEVVDVVRAAFGLHLLSQETVKGVLQSEREHFDRLREKNAVVEECAEPSCTTGNVGVCRGCGVGRCAIHSRIWDLHSLQCPERRFAEKWQAELDPRERQARGGDWRF